MLTLEKAEYIADYIAVHAGEHAAHMIGGKAVHHALAALAQLGQVAADVVIDFSHHTAVADVLAFARQTGCAAVIGTTGHTPEEKQRILEAAREIPVFYSGNMSLGIAVLCKLAKQAAACFPEADIEIVEIHQSLQKVLEKYLHLNKVELIKCGNGKRIDAEREQWSDGVNLLCIRPGVVMAYDRNFVTNQALKKHGIKVIEIPSSELSRGRGGSHCMTMALVREEE